MELLLMCACRNHTLQDHTHTNKVPLVVGGIRLEGSVTRSGGET